MLNKQSGMQPLSQVMKTQEVGAAACVWTPLSPLHACVFVTERTGGVLVLNSSKPTVIIEQSERRRRSYHVCGWMWWSLRTDSILAAHQITAVDALVAGGCSCNRIITMLAAVWTIQDMRYLSVKFPPLWEEGRLNFLWSVQSTGKRELNNSAAFLDWNSWGCFWKRVLHFY